MIPVRIPLVSMPTRILIGPSYPRSSGSISVVQQLLAAGLVVAAGLILAERIGKAVRSPAKSALMGRGLGVHKALDQVGALRRRDEAARARGAERPGPGD